jgi:prepilin-type N-terminal cleavage/methylation domain-containing protein
MKTNKQGFTLVEIMIVVAIIGLLAAIAIPSFMKARTTSQQKACINNLRQIESGKEQWALANKKAEGDDIVTTEIDVYMKDSPDCPAGGTYVYGKIGTDADCSITTPVSHTL